MAPSKLSALMDASARPVDVLATALRALAMRDAQRLHHGPETTVIVARRLIQLMVASLALPRGATAAKRALGEVECAGSVLTALGVAPRPAALRAVSKTLILCADHGLNPSSFAARVAASAGADLYACVGAALATASGTRHGGMPARVASLVEEIGRPSRTAQILGERLQRGDDIPGFGHTLYPEGDPRTAPLLEAARNVAPRSRPVAIIEAVVSTMVLAGGQPPTVDVGLAAVAAALGLPRGGATALFAIGRAAGWVAQVMEQREAGHVLRPRARYVGP
jgi:citrate synthase